jgi:hypothetical protein
VVVTQRQMLCSALMLLLRRLATMREGQQQQLMRV